MAEATAMPDIGPAPQFRPETKAEHKERVLQERTLYTASTGRKVIFSFVFLILLPFFISLPAMLFMRIKYGLLQDTIGLAIMAIAFTIIMGLVTIELLFSIRARIELDDHKVSMTLPTGRGPTPMFFYRSHEIPYAAIDTVETRREIYGGGAVPVLLKGARLTLKDGRSIPIGYISEANVDPCFPYPEIARKIAERARLPLIDRGNVRRSFRRKFLGLRSGGVNEVDTVDEAQIEQLNRSHRNVVMGLVSGLVVLIVIGIVHDFASNVQIGQTASTFAPEPATKAPAKAPAKKTPTKTK